MARFQPHSHVTGVRDNGVRFFARFDLHVIHIARDMGCSFEKEADGFGAGFGTLGDWSAIRDSSEDAVAEMYAKASRFLKMRGKWSDATKGITIARDLPAHLSEARNDVEVIKAFSEMSVHDPAVRAIWSACTLGSLTNDELKSLAGRVQPLAMNCAIEYARRAVMEG